MISLNDLNKAIILYQSSPYSTKLEVMMNYYNSLNDINRVIDDACFGRSIDEDEFQIISDHYWNQFNRGLYGRKRMSYLDWLYEYRSRLIDYFSNKTNTPEDFQSLHNDVKKLKNNPVNLMGFGDLFFYDVSLRVGSHLGIYPKMIYLHAGAKEGYKKIFDNPNTTNENYISFYSKSIYFLNMKPYQIENFLCVAKVQKWI